MRIDTTLKIRDVAGEHIVIRQSDGVSDMTRVMALNGTAMELYQALQGRDFTEDDVVDYLVGQFDVDRDTARRDAAAWLQQMREQALVTE